MLNGNEKQKKYTVCRRTWLFKDTDVEYNWGDFGRSH